MEMSNKNENSINTRVDEIQQVIQALICMDFDTYSEIG